ncbi:MAG TPA: hypothetical protein VM577_03725 [Anaerovoracaceae bacterium]|nr:hypothetical protein [Anaerovoracaceae bacterium]
MDPYKMIEHIDTKTDLANFIGELRSNLISNPSDWENASLDRFLEAMEAWINAMDSYGKNTGDMDVTQPNWKTFAKMLYAAKVYE